MYVTELFDIQRVCVSDLIYKVCGASRYKTSTYERIVSACFALDTM